MQMAEICADLAAETDDLDAVLVGLAPHDWARPTPAEGWDVADQVRHLAAVDEVAVRAATDPEGFAAEKPRPRADASRSPGGEELREWFRSARRQLLDVLGALEPGARIPWYGPSMSATSFATARLMETWAHGQDVVDALGVDRPPTDRLRHVCHIGVLARPFSYSNRGLELPAAPVRVELRAPSGATWTWGEEGADQRVRGDAVDFALVVTQRRHPADTGLVAEGPQAAEWLGIAQAFAGPPGPGRRPGQFAPRPGGGHG